MWSSVGLECFKTWDKKEGKSVVYLESWLFLSYALRICPNVRGWSSHSKHVALLLLGQTSCPAR